MNTKLFVGLGNPGSKFEGTRHNLGIDVVRAWYEHARDSSMHVIPWKHNVSVRADIAEVVHSPQQKTVCLFPVTYMNTSGVAVRLYMKDSNIDRSDIVIVHDDIELPLGEWRVYEGGSAAGHNGVRSIHQELGVSDIRRVRIGAGRPIDETPVHAFVLQSFSVHEQERLNDILPDIIRELDGLAC